MIREHPVSRQAFYVIVSGENERGSANHTGFGKVRWYAVMIETSLA